MLRDTIPPWAVDILRCPATAESLVQNGNSLFTPNGAEVARIEQYVIRFPVKAPSETIAFYRSVGGAHFHERSSTPFAMSTLDTPVYHRWLGEIMPADRESLVVDVGGGDGRNAVAFLRQGARKVVVVDVVAEALIRFRNRVAQSNPDWLDRLLLVEADARALPLASGCAAAVFSIETLCYLNEEYADGLRQCVRLLAPAGRILVADRDYESGLVLRLIYHGLEAMLTSAGTRDIWDGRGENVTRSRSFTEQELVTACRAAGLSPLTVGGVSILSLLMGYLNGRDLLGDQAQRHLDGLRQLLLNLSRTGAMRRSHVVIARLA